MIDAKIIIDRFNRNQCLVVLPPIFRNYVKEDYPLSSLKQIILSILEELDDTKLLIVLLECMTAREYDLFKKSLSIQCEKKELQTYLYNKVLKVKDIRLLKKYFGIYFTNSNMCYEPDYEMFLGDQQRFYELFDYQVSIKEKVLNLLECNSNIVRTLIHMPTGTGKTKTTMHIINQYYLDSILNDGYVVWIAHTNVLLEQAVETFKNVWAHLGVGDIPIIRYYDNHDIYVETPKYGIVFASISKLISASKKNSYGYRTIKNNSRLVIFDEAHKCTAKATKIVLDDILELSSKEEKKAFLGLTATPGRNTYDNDENKELAMFFDNHIIRIDPSIIQQFSNSGIYDNTTKKLDGKIIHYFQQRNILSKLKKETLKYDFVFSKTDIKIINKKSNSNSEDYSAEFISVYENNVKRNEVILEKLIQLSNDNIPTIVFACSVAHGEFLSAMLKLSGIKSGQVYGKTPKQIRNDTIKGFKNNKFNILINCGVLTTGFDSTNIKCVFITRPTKSVVLYSQMIGRGLRGKKMGGNKECLLVDLEDNLNRFKDPSDSFSYFDSYWS